MRNTNSRLFAYFSVLSVAGIGITGCGDEAAEPADAQARISTMVPSLISSVGEATASTEAIEPMSALSASMDTLSTMVGGSSEEPLPGLRSPAFLRLLAPEDPVAEEADPGAALASTLNQYLFNEQSYEGDGYYRLRGDVVCELDGMVDQECAAEIDRAEVRVRALLAGNGLDLTLLVGPERAAPLALELRSERAELMFDLAQTKAAIAHLEGSDAELPEVFEGVVALSLIVHGPKDVTLAAAVSQAIRVSDNQDNAANAYSFSTEAKDPLFSVRMNGAASKLDFSFDVGRTIVRMPWDAISGAFASDTGTPAAATGSVFAMDFGGLSATTSMSAGDTSARISNIGLGDTTTTIKLDDQVLFSLDLNAALGRRFALDITPNASGLASLAFDPGFDLLLGFDLRPLLPAGEEPIDAVTHETYRISLTGMKPTIELIPAATLFGRGSLRVSSGTLSIESTTVASQLTVEAGQCLLPTEPAADGHPVLGTLSAGACQ